MTLEEMDAGQSGKIIGNHSQAGLNGLKGGQGDNQGKRNADARPGNSKGRQLADSAGPWYGKEDTR